MTTTINYVFGAGVLSPSTSIVLNNEVDDFSTPTENTADKLSPALANFIEPNKRPLSSMTPIIFLKLIPNVVLYENWTMVDGDHIELSDKSKSFLADRNHLLKGQASGAVCQLIVQTPQTAINMERKSRSGLVIKFPMASLLV
ncbi:hypothetical protein GIB67_026343 [Kingdonia uniflora]|uniref:Uncharacterized protein n=1 Tax=Kingdonia uniflora TaxID=39325 RepID=A0A7J7P5Y8_9MAGN|nr:hypothetical protein GIB67_026343 [Kingdonia uniflora]